MTTRFLEKFSWIWQYGLNLFILNFKLLNDDATRDPRTAWCVHRSMRVGAIFFDFGAGAVRDFQILARDFQIPTGSGAWISGYDCKRFDQFAFMCQSP